LGHAFRFVEIANDVNEHMPDYVVRRLLLAFNRRSLALNGSTVLVLGLAYKANSSDARESPVVAIVEQLLELGAVIRLADPLVGASPLDDRVTRVTATVTEAQHADGVVLLTDHEAFDLDALVSASRYFFDTRHRVAGATVEYL
jgi:UDP-N-acetyl-D-glucosamine dehydrogenase